MFLPDKDRQEPFFKVSRPALILTLRGPQASIAVITVREHRLTPARSSIVHTEPVSPTPSKSIVTPLDIPYAQTINPHPPLPALCQTHNLRTCCPKLRIVHIPRRCYYPHDAGQSVYHACLALSTILSFVCLHISTMLAGGGTSIAVWQRAVPGQGRIRASFHPR
jgi:hypothetical protein